MEAALKAGSFATNTQSVRLRPSNNSTGWRGVTAVVSIESAARTAVVRHSMVVTTSKRRTVGRDFMSDISVVATSASKSWLVDLLALVTTCSMRIWHGPRDRAPVVDRNQARD